MYGWSIRLAGTRRFSGLTASNKTQMYGSYKTKISGLDPLAALAGAERHEPPPQSAKPPALP